MFFFSALSVISLLHVRLSRVIKIILTYLLTYLSVLWPFTKFITHTSPPATTTTTTTITKVLIIVTFHQS